MRKERKKKQGGKNHKLSTAGLLQVGILGVPQCGSGEGGERVSLRSSVSIRDWERLTNLELSLKVRFWKQCGYKHVRLPSGVCGESLRRISNPRKINLNVNKLSTIAAVCVCV